MTTKSQILLVIVIVLLAGLGLYNFYAIHNLKMPVPSEAMMIDEKPTPVRSQVFDEPAPAELPDADTDEEADDDNADVLTSGPLESSEPDTSRDQPTSPDEGLSAGERVDDGPEASAQDESESTENDSSIRPQTPPELLDQQ